MLMYQHVLIPVALDHEGIVDSKIAAARRLLAENGKITLLTVLENIPGFVAELVTTFLDEAPEMIRYLNDKFPQPAPWECGEN